MKIGILSDTHDNLPLIKKAVDYFNNLKVDLVLHAGDYIAPFSVKALNLLNCPWQGVFGNNDGEKKGLTAVSQGKIKEPPLFLDLDAKRISLVHEFRKDLDADIIICGHTHIPEIKKQENALIINPGETCGWLSNKSTLAVLDSSSMAAEIIDL